MCKHVENIVTMFFIRENVTVSAASCSPVRCTLLPPDRRGGLTPIYSIYRQPLSIVVSV